MSTTIKFGTAGWRAIIAQDYTFDNVRLVSQATADYLKAELANPQSPIHGWTPSVILGYDCRFLGLQFAMAAAEVMEANGLNPILCDRDTPTPVLSYTIRKRKLIAGINITASHNPAEYSGFKLSRWDGAGAPSEVTKEIEGTVAKLQQMNWSFKREPSGVFHCKTINPQPDYFKQIRKLVDFATIRKAKVKLAVDLMYGCGRGYLDALLKEAGAKLVVFHDHLDPLFGGSSPEPSAEHLVDVRKTVRRREAQLGLGTDGDADRFGIVDQDGTWMTPNQILALTLYHLKKNRGWTGAVVRTVPSSHQVDAVAQMLGVKVHEVPVGFKYIGALMQSEAIIVGGEESGGLSVKGHVPEKDGIIACLLMVELIATERKTLKEILKEIEKKVGPFYTERINVTIAPDKMAALQARLSAGLNEVGPFKVEKFITTDGCKFLLPNSEWVAFRASGTEPLFRCYIEAKSKKHMEVLKDACRKLLNS